MPRFLSGQTNQCCCPEMRCCTPETVTATTSGFNGVQIGGWNIRKVVAESEYDPDGVGLNPEFFNDDYYYTSGAGECVDSRAGSLYHVMMRDDPYAAIYEVGGSTGECYDFTWGCAYPETWPIPEDQWPPRTIYSPTSIWWDVASVIWPSIAFPQRYGWGGYNGNSQIGYRTDCWLPFYNDTPPSYYVRRSGELALEFRYDTDFNAQCASVPKLCQKPTDTSFYFTPATGGVACESDYNGTYVCHRATVAQRPELEAVISRSASGQRNTVREEARIIFEVYCRRRWSTGSGCPGLYISNFVCTPVLDPPDNSLGEGWHCVDYRCEREPGTNLCDYGACGADQGFAKPRLKAYHELGNQSANLRLVLQPAQYMSGQVQFNEGGPTGTLTLLDKMRKPFSWRVDSVEIKNGGAGYEVGEFFIVSFDEDWIAVLGGGPVVVNLPSKDWECMGGGTVSWKDKYDFTGIITPLGTVQFQRLRVSSVDASGAITGLEVVPWYRDPDYGPGCIERPLNNRTPYFPQYTRALCHPMSVDVGGKGYLRGDTITFVFKHPSCAAGTNPRCIMHTQAVATVTDVDEDGAIQDWHIRGSDLCNYGYCEGLDCIDSYYTEPDERGAYRFDGKQLCTLEWSGVGVPVRRVGSIKRSPTTDSRIVNASTLTATSVQISRSPCRTGIEVLVNDWFADFPIYKDAATPNSNGNPQGGQAEQAAGLFPPWPKCWGGGAVITPVIGTTGANDSEIGGPLTGGIVVSGGTGFAFRDKRHVEPNLDKNVPDIVGENGTGTGAKISTFGFASVLNFPYVGYMGGLLAPDPAADRFAYYPVTSVTIDPDHRGTGYEVDMEFDIAPVGGGRPVSDMWTDGGGDNPDADVHGSFYGGYRARLIDPTTGLYSVNSGVVRQSKARVKITGVNSQGGITSVEVLHGGMMFKPVWTTGKQHPDARLMLTSDTGDGAKVTMTVNTNHESPLFGRVTAVTVVQMPVGEESDPLHSTPGSPVAYPLGGRDYANPPSGLMWELGNISIGGWTCISALDWRSPLILNPADSDKSTHDFVEGSSNFPYIRRAERCHLGECYQPLLQKTYQLWTVMGGPTWVDSRFEGVRSDVVQGGLESKSLLPMPATNRFLPPGRPPYSYALCRRKGTRNNSWSGDENLPVAGAGDWAVLMWGPTVTLGYTAPATCADHEVGRTSV